MSLRKIIESLAEQPVSVRGQTPHVMRLETYPATVETAVLPARLISGADRNSEAGDGRFVAMGRLERVNYIIEDLFLLRPIAQGIGPGDAEDQLIEYIDGYRELLRQWRAAGQQQAHLENFALRKGAEEWPAQSGKWYYGVTATLNVSEWYSGA